MPGNMVPPVVSIATVSKPAGGACAAAVTATILSPSIHRTPSGITVNAASICAMRPRSACLVVAMVTPDTCRNRATRTAESLSRRHSYARLNRPAVAICRPGGCRRYRPFEYLLALVRQAEPDVQLAQLLRADLGRGAHQQILGALVHREQHDLA